MRTARPYGSHRYPACARCHKRRSRCVIDVPGQPCSHCRNRDAPCSLASIKSPSAAPKVGFTHRSLLADDQSLDYQARVIGPLVARDTQVLDQHIPQSRDELKGMHIFSVPNERETREAVYVVPLPPRTPSPIGFSQYSDDLSEKLLAQVDPFLDKLLANYFEHLAPCYPLTNEEYIMTRVKNRNTLPRTFLVLLISYALFYWDLYPALSVYPRPDQNLAWRISVMSNAMNLHGGDVATIGAICLGISGRPYQRVVHNGGNVARTVAVAHTIGLNHDCRGWKTATDIEKSLRWKVWWAVLIQDRWFNFAQGTPTYISKNQYDVPIPTMELLVPPSRGSSLVHVRASEIYIQLCRLTEILGDVLPLVYQFRTGTNENVIADQVAQSEVDLDRWLESLPSWLMLEDVFDRTDIPGRRNLQLSYLSVRMLLQRIAWHETSRCQRETELASSWLSRCQTAAERIVQFVTSLQKSELIAFWLPCNAQHFTSAVTLLLRCALQTSDSNVQAQCMSSARALVNCLQRYQDEDHWDLAELCLLQTHLVLRRIEDSLPRTSGNADGTAPIAPVVAAHHDFYTRSYVEDGSDNGMVAGNVFETLQERASSLQDVFPELFGDWINDNFVAGSDFLMFDE